jgi:hypothetical protein
MRTLAISGKKMAWHDHQKENNFDVSLLGITMAVAIFDLQTALMVGSLITACVLVTDATFSIIVTYIFLKPMLDVLQAAGGNAPTAASRRLERTKRWNFAGVLVTVGSSTVLYINVIAYFVLTALRYHSLNRSVWGNPGTFGFAADSLLNTFGMILLSGMFKDVSLPSRIVFMSNNKVAAVALKEQNNESGYINDSSACSEQAGTTAESPVPGNPALKNTRRAGL